MHSQSIKAYQPSNQRQVKNSIDFNNNMFIHIIYIYLFLKIQGIPTNELGKGFEMTKKDEMLLRKMYSCPDISEPYQAMKCKQTNFKLFKLKWYITWLRQSKSAFLLFSSPLLQKSLLPSSQVLGMSLGQNFSARA